jgi:uncharacterized protein (DUF1330 family)
MPKGYWIATYKAVRDPAKLAEYAKIAAPAMEAGGAKFLARGMPTAVFEAGLNQRTVVIQFPSVEAAIKTHDSEIYQKALKALGDSAEREIRIIEGLE